MTKHRLSIKAKIRLIAVLGTVVVLVLAVVIGGNLYIDSILNKMNQKMLNNTWEFITFMANMMQASLLKKIKNATVLNLWKG